MRSERIHAGSRFASFTLVGMVSALVVLSPSDAYAQPRESKTSLAGSLELTRLLDLSADRLSIRVEYVPGQLTGSTTMRGEIPDSDLWQVVNARLADAGWTSVQSGGPRRFRVVKLDDKLASMATLRVATWKSSTGTPAEDALQVDWEETTLRPGFAAVVVPIRFRSAKEIADTLKPLLTKSVGTVQTLGDTGDRIIIADLTSRLDEILRLLPQIDSATEGPAFETVAVKNVGAAQLVASAKEIAAKRDLVGGNPGANKPTGELIPSPDGSSVLVIASRANLAFFRELIAGLDAVPGVQTKEYAPHAFATKEVAALIGQLIPSTPDGRFKVVSDDLTGTLIVTATPDQHERIAALMTRLDATPVEATSRLRSFAIRNRPVKDVADALNQLLAAGEIDVGPAGPSRGPLTPSVPPNAAVPGANEPPESAAGAAARSARTGPKSASDARNAQTRPQITMTVDEGMNTLIVVGEPRMLTQIETLLKTLDVRQPQVMIEVTLVSLTDGQSLALGVELQKFGSLGGNAIQLSSLFGSAATGTPPNITGAPGTGFTGAALNQGEFNAVLKALERVNAGRSSSTPRVLVANNQEANFKSVAQQPTSNTSTNTTSTTITSFGGFQDAGTTIRVKPQIAEGDRLTLDYSVELSSFTGQPTGGLPSARQQNSVASVSQIPDGFTVVVGGFELKTESEDESRVPLIGQIPVVGELFKSRTKTHDRTRFFAFIRASIMRGGGFEELKYVSTKDIAASAIDDNWPKVEPLVIR